LLDRLIEVMGLKNDASLSRVLEVAPPVISKIRHGRLDIGPILLIGAHEESGLSIKEMKAMIGQRVAIVANGRQHEYRRSLLQTA
jgi:hypothetical protein